MNVVIDVLALSYGEERLIAMFSTMAVIGAIVGSVLLAQRRWRRRKAERDAAKDQRD